MKARSLLAGSLVLSVAAAIAVPARAASNDLKTAADALAAKWTSAWNAHDAKKMAAVFSEDGNLLNPFNRAEKGRAEIESLFTEEQSGPMKSTTYKVESSSLNQLSDDCAVLDWSGVVTGIVGPDGKPQPPFSHHVTHVLVKKGAKWEDVLVRAYVFAPPPPPPAAAPAKKK
jgi:uncharacterized protein (TIGR02246 family)